eukprot:CAMPEP_0116962998 /NCGR_PEP_ID=MMETSP0467-20121206/47633_1 /TAXON_ID=283647 /ORGANISM="Mesodinium pulex, Strain SPMC105" /LENGTH=53 /DNA_ID=CAMNT_0004651511 /DNA_START=59 /DNA_END=217 /DNA_ORIENTATION=+
MPAPSVHEPMITFFQSPPLNALDSLNRSGVNIDSRELATKEDAKADKNIFNIV